MAGVQRLHRLSASRYRARGESLEQRLLLSAGELDSSFDTDGWTSTDFGFRTDIARAVQVYDSGPLAGRIVVAGGSSVAGQDAGFAVARYLPNGEPDTSLDVDGRLLTDVGGGFLGGNGLALQSDGKMVVVGEGLQAGEFDFAIARYNTDGSLDGSFGNGGIVYQDFPDAFPTLASSDRAYGVDIDSQGRIVVVGRTENNVVVDLAIARYLPNGMRDNAFGAGTGLVVRSFGGSDWAYDVAVNPADDSFVVAASGGFAVPGAVHQFPGVLKFNADGTLDATFGSNGVTQLTINGDEVTDLELEFDSLGRIVMSGTVRNDADLRGFVARLQANGSLDTFGIAGIAEIVRNDPFLPHSSVSVRGMLLQGDTIVVVGSWGFANFMVARLDATGSLIAFTPGIDAPDADDDFAIATFSGGVYNAHAIAQDSAGRWIVAGEGRQVINTDFQVARFEGLPIPHDFGDAPMGYGTLLADDGARHWSIDNGPVLGARTDNEPDGQPNSTATGDDAVGAMDDEDGVLNPLADLVVTEGSQPVVTLMATNPGGQLATVHGWIDFNGDGLFDTASEHAEVNLFGGSVNQRVTLRFPTIPSGTAGPTYARFRISTDAAAGDPIGLARDGEVEDYAVTIHAPTSGTVREPLKISDTVGNFSGVLDDEDIFGFGLASIGDLDGDGIFDLAVGADQDDDGGMNRGAVWILFMNADGTVKGHQKISDTEGGFTGELDDRDGFGVSVARLGDLDGDGVTEIAVGAVENDEANGEVGAVWILFLNSDGTVKAHQKISEGHGDFTGPLEHRGYFGFDVDGLGDLNGDGVADLLVGADRADAGGDRRGEVWVLFLNGDGTVQSQQKISSTTGGLFGPIEDGDHFGVAVANLGDLDGDGITDIAVGGFDDDDRTGQGLEGKGGVWVLFLNADGTVKSEQKISELEGNFTGSLAANEWFGRALAAAGDVDGDGNRDVLVGSFGTVRLLLLNNEGKVKRHTIVASAATLPESSGTLFGAAVDVLGDLDSDTVVDLVVGAAYDNDGGLQRGAAWLLLLNRSDSDQDGISDFLEDAAPNSGDGNNDSVPDSSQTHVTSLPNAVDGSYLTLVAPIGSSLVDVQAIDNPSPSDAPASASFPFGFLGFTVDGLLPGASAQVELIVHGGPTPTTFYKYGPSPTDPMAHWWEFTYDGATGAQIIGNTITLTLIDGGRGDSDTVINGMITDPGAPAIPVSGTLGDFDGNGSVTDNDIDLLCQQVHSGSGNLTFDLDGNQSVDQADVAMLVNTILGTAFGDVNLDGVVTASVDGAVLITNLGATSQGWADGDFDCDGQVTASGDGAMLLSGLSGDSAGASAQEWGDEVAITLTRGFLARPTTLHTARRHTLPFGHRPWSAHATKPADWPSDVVMPPSELTAQPPHSRDGLGRRAIRDNTFVNVVDWLWGQWSGLDSWRF